MLSPDTKGGQKVWGWRHHGPPKRWYPTKTLHGVTAQKTSIRIFTAVKTSNLAAHEAYAKKWLTPYTYEFGKCLADQCSSNVVALVSQNGRHSVYMKISHMNLNKSFFKMIVISTRPCMDEEIFLRQATSTKRQTHTCGTLQKCIFFVCKISV